MLVSHKAQLEYTTTNTEASEGKDTQAEDGTIAAWVWCFCFPLSIPELTVF